MDNALDPRNKRHESMSSRPLCFALRTDLEEKSLAVSNCIDTLQYFICLLLYYELYTPL